MKKDTLLVLLLLTAEIICIEKLYELYMQYVGRLFGWVSSSLWSDAFVAVLCALGVWWLIVEDSHPSLEVYRDVARNVKAFMAGVLCLYGLIWHPEQCVTFQTVSFLPYAIVPLAWLITWYVTPYMRTFKSSDESEVVENRAKNGEEEILHRLFGDDTHPKKDLLGREAEVKVVCDYLLDPNNEYSTAIAVAINGEWGAGKTTFLQYIQDQLNNKEIHYFTYSPWHRSTDDVTLDFLTYLQQFLKEGSGDFDSLQQYIRSLKVSNVTGWFSVAVHAVTHFFGYHEKSIEQQFSEVAQDMSTLKYPVITFIDDVDRISGEDFRDVMRLIRATASFPKLIYVVAFDEDIAIRMLENVGGKRYLQKIFNVTHTLQPVSEENMQALSTSLFFKLYGKEYEDLADKNATPFAGLDILIYLPTLRDMYRYFNLLNKDYMATSTLREQVYFPFNTYALLELLKFTDQIAWRLLKDSPTTYLTVERDNLHDMAAYRLKPQASMDERTKNLLTAIFDSETGILNEFITPRCFQKLFHDRLGDGYLSRKDFEDALNKGQLVANVAQWSKTLEGINWLLGHNLESLSVSDLAQICISLIENRRNIDISPDNNQLQISTAEPITLTSFSSIKNVYNPYAYVEQQHELYLYFESMASESEDEDQMYAELKEFAEKTENPREMLAVIFGLHLCNQGLDGRDLNWIVDIENVLFTKLLTQCKSMTLESQYYVMEALTYTPGFPMSWIEKIVADDPGFWLRLTLLKEEAIGATTHIVANPDILCILFDTYDSYKDMISRILYELQDVDKKTIIQEHIRLVENTSLIYVMPISSYQVENYPHLNAIQYKDLMSEFFLSTCYEGTKERFEVGDVPFYNNKSRFVS